MLFVKNSNLDEKLSKEVRLRNIFTKLAALFRSGVMTFKEKKIDLHGIIIRSA